MIDLRRQEDHYHHRRGWLKTDWHFSFGEYRDPNNMSFGPLRVVNNDWIDGNGGFPMHSHDNMEIITWIIRGSLVHEDSTGSTETVGRNAVQTMSAGTGISHSEYNASKTEPLRLLQIWIEPDKRGVEPRYEDAKFDDDRLGREWVTIASGQPGDGTTIHQDVSMLVRHPSSGETFDHETTSDRRVYVVDIEGDLRLNDTDLFEGDAARVEDEARLEFEAETDAEVLLIDLP